MSRNGLTPWNWHRSSSLAHPSTNSFATLQRDMNQLFEGFFDSGPLQQLAGNDRAALSAPKLDVSETERELHVTAELPGVKEDDINVELTGDTLRIHGVKQDEREEKEHRFHRVERSFGSFERVISIPADIDRQNVRATFKNGVLEISLPKSAAPTSQKIAVKRGS